MVGPGVLTSVLECDCVVGKWSGARCAGDWKGAVDFVA